MFYSDSISETYRMGDIVSGYAEITPIYTPNMDNGAFSLSIDVIPSGLFVVLTPCCSIENKLVSIAPLKKLDVRFLSSDKLIEDFLLINRPIAKRVAMGEAAFSKLAPEEKIIEENALPQYTYLDKFVYDDHAIMEEYPLTKKRGKDEIVTISTGKYMISFKDASRIQSTVFDRQNCSYCEKIAELSPRSRQWLRDKLSFFYSRVPEEDRPFLA